MSEALEGVTVLEFGAYAAGPAIGKYLANFGALVIHVESKGRPDGFRLQYPPYKDDKVGLNRGGCFAFFNDSKLGVTIDLKHPDAAGLVRRMTERVDIVIENMRPGVMERLGIGYARLSAINPRLVFLSTNNMGQTGPNRSHPGFGSQLSSQSGFTELIGRPDGPPGFIYGPYIDLIAVAYGGAAVLAALDRARRTGEGAHIDLAQYEAGLQFLAPALLDFDANGVIAHRNRNHEPNAVPHNAYPCLGDRDCTISCWDDDEWQRLCRAAKRPQWAHDARFATADARRAHEAELDEELSAWTRTQEARDLMALLQHHGVHAAVVNTMADLFTDPQIDARDVWQPHEHAEIGTQRYRMVSYQLSETPGRIRHAAPCIGEHNVNVFRDWLGLSDQEYRDLENRGVFS